LRYPDVRSIVSHSGGLMPFTFKRSNTPQGAETKEEVATRNAMLSVVRQFHYERHIRTTRSACRRSEAHPGFADYVRTDIH